MTGDHDLFGVPADPSYNRDRCYCATGPHHHPACPSVECECGKVVLGEASPFPADVAFRDHLADEIMNEVGDATEIAGRLSALLCDLTGGQLSKANYPVAIMTQAIEERLAEHYESDAQSEVEALRSQLAGRCLSDITHRDEEHRQSLCMLPADHAPLAHDDCMGCTWTDADHWQPQAVDRLADELARVADESQHEGWDSPAVRRVVARLRAAFEEPQP